MMMMKCEFMCHVTGFVMQIHSKDKHNDFHVLVTIIITFVITVKHLGYINNK